MSARTILLIALLLTALALFVTFFDTQDTAPVQSSKINPTRTILFENVSVRVAAADTEPLRQRGLSGMTGLAPDQGMLFVFDKDGMYSFWMHEMLFSIDILWLAADGQVVHIEKDVSPQSYPASFTSDSPARYVLELPAGFSDQHRIIIGSSASLE